MQIGRTFLSIAVSTVLLAGCAVCFPHEIAAQREGALREDGIAVTTTPSGEADRIYIMRGNEIDCLDAKTTHVLWTSPATEIDDGPVVLGKTVIDVHDGWGDVKGLNADNGSVRWTVDDPSGIITGDHTTLFMATLGTGVAALDAQTGRKLWEHEGGVPGWNPELVHAGGNLYTDFYVLNASTGRLIQKYVGWKSVVEAGTDAVFEATYNGRIEAVDARTNRLKWKAATSGHVHPVAMSTNDKFLFLASYNGDGLEPHTGTLEAFGAADGREIWKLPLASSKQELEDHPIGSDQDHVYLLTPSGDSTIQLAALSATTGKPIWSHDFERGVYGPPVIAGGILYMTDWPDVLYEIDKNSGKVLLRAELPKRK